MAALGRLSVLVEAEVAKFQSDMGKAMRETQKQVRELERAANNEMRKMQRQFQSTADLAKRALGGIATGFAVREVTRMADTWSDLSSRVRQSIKPHQDAGEVMSRLATISRQTYSSLELTGEAFARNAMTLNALGKSTLQQLDYAQALNNALVVSGARADRAVMVQNSLAKAMAEGTLRGEELNNVLSFGGRIAEVLADELGVGVTELRKLSAQGKITGDVMFNSLVKNMEKLTAEAEEMPATIGDAFTLMRNSILQTVGVFDQQNKLSETFAEKLIVIADNMGKVIKAAVALGAIMAGLWATKVTAQAINFTTLLIAQGLQYAKNATLATAWAAANGAGFAASIKSVGLLNIALGGVAASLAGWQIGKWLREQFLEAELAGIALVAGLLVGWERLKQGAAIAFAGIQLAWGLLIGGMGDLWAGFVNLVADGVDLLPEKLGGGHAQSMRDYAESIGGTAAAIEQFRDRVDRANQVADAQIGIHREITDAMADDAIARRQVSDETSTLNEVTTTNTAINVDNAASIKAQAKALEEFQKIRSSLVFDAETMAAEESGDEAVAMLEYERAIESVRDRMYEMAVAAQAGRASIDELNEANVAAAQIITLSERATNRELKAIKEKRDVIGRLNRTYSEQLKMLGMTRRELFQYEAAARAVADAQDALGDSATPEMLAETANQAREIAGAFFDSSEQIERVRGILDEFGDNAFDGLTSKIADLRAEIERLSDPMSDAFDPARVAELERAVGRVKVAIAQDMVGSTAAALRGIQSMTEEGSNSYRNLGIAVEALTATQAILGIVNQSGGDPYTAFARMAAMAAIMAQFVGNVAGSFGGSGPSAAAQRQATQGTGSVLGDSEAKSESILRATEITADATSALVGINRGMLRALTSLQQGLSGAATQLARGAGDVEFGGFDPGTMLNARNGAVMGAAVGSIIPIIGTAVGAVVGAILGSLLRGSSELSDQGILVRGGGLDDVGFGAYQEHEVRRWRWGSRRTVGLEADLPDDITRQFDLVMQSIVDTVAEAALALGIDQEEIQRRLDSYQQEEIRISLMDLSAEEQEAELQAVFSQIFDDIASHVVPFIEQFQQVGEGLGETLVRVATSVQVMREAVRYLGIAIDEADPERFAQISVAMMDLMGGIEEFATAMQQFTASFATDEWRFAVAQSELTDAFEQAGLTIPETRDAMWALMQSLDATTEEGREQIATLLRLAGVADEYYRLIEDQAEAMERATEAGRQLDDLYRFLARGDWSAPVQSIIDLDNEYREHVATIQRLARESGRAEASERELAMARNWHQRQLRRLTAELMQSATDIAAQLGFGVGYSQSEIVGAEIGGISEVTEAVEDRYARELQLLQELDQYVRSLGISELSPLNPAERLNEAEAEYQRILGLAQGGDLDALAQLHGAAQAYLSEAQSFYGGVGAYEDIFNSVRDTLRQLVDAGPQNEPTVPQTPVYGGPVTVEPGEEWMRMSEHERAALAQQLVDHIAALSLALRDPVMTIMDELGITMLQLVESLGIDLRTIGAETVESLANLALGLGLSLTDIVAALDMRLPELAAGIRELADGMGISLDEIVNSTGTALLDLAQYLGVNLEELGVALGMELGALTDASSPIFTALLDVIGSLSPEIADVLGPLLDDVANAATEADANAAIGAVESAINDMPAGIRDLLAPFFDNVFPVGALTDLHYLESIDGGIATMIEVLRRIEANTYVPGYAQGTPFVPNTGLALLHKGEAVVPADIAARMRAGEMVTLAQLDTANDGEAGGSLERRMDRLIDLTERMLETENRQLSAMNRAPTPGYRNVA